LAPQNRECNAWSSRRNPAAELWLAIAERDFRRWLSPEMGSLARNVRVTFEKLKPTTTRE
jgi:hypothetical protein